MVPGKIFFSQKINKKFYRATPKSEKKYQGILKNISNKFRDKNVFIQISPVNPLVGIFTPRKILGSGKLY